MVITCLYLPFSIIEPSVASICQLKLFAFFTFQFKVNCIANDERHCQQFTDG